MATVEENAELLLQIACAYPPDDDGDARIPRSYLGPVSGLTDDEIDAAARMLASSGAATLLPVGAIDEGRVAFVFPTIKGRVLVDSTITFDADGLLIRALDSGQFNVIKKAEIERFEFSY